MKAPSFFRSDFLVCSSTGWVRGGICHEQRWQETETGYLQFVFKFILTLDALIVSGKKRLERNQLRRFEPSLRKSMECHRNPGMNIVDIITAAQMECPLKKRFSAFCGLPKRSTSIHRNANKDTEKLTRCHFCFWRQFLQSSKAFSQSEVCVSDCFFFSFFGVKSERLWQWKRT